MLQGYQHFVGFFAARAEWLTNRLAHIIFAVLKSLVFCEIIYVRMEFIQASNFFF